MDEKEMRRLWVQVDRAARRLHKSRGDEAVWDALLKYCWARVELLRFIRLEGTMEQWMDCPHSSFLDEADLERCGEALEKHRSEPS
jgi:hypothetical protein